MNGTVPTPVTAPIAAKKIPVSEPTSDQILALVSQDSPIGAEVFSEYQSLKTLNAAVNQTSFDSFIEHIHLEVWRKNPLQILNYFLHSLENRKKLMASKLLTQVAQGADGITEKRKAIIEALQAYFYADKPNPTLANFLQQNPLIFFKLCGNNQNNQIHSLINASPNPVEFIKYFLQQFARVLVNSNNAENKKTLENALFYLVAELDNRVTHSKVKDFINAIIPGTVPSQSLKEILRPRILHRLGSRQDEAAEEQDGKLPPVVEESASNTEPQQQANAGDETLPPVCEDSDTQTQTQSVLPPVQDNTSDTHTQHQSAVASDVLPPVLVDNDDEAQTQTALPPVYVVTEEAQTAQPKNKVEAGATAPLLAIAKSLVISECLGLQREPAFVNFLVACDDKQASKRVAFDENMWSKVKKTNDLYNKDDFLSQRWAMEKDYQSNMAKYVKTEFNLREKLKEQKQPITKLLPEAAGVIALNTTLWKQIDPGQHKAKRLFNYLFADSWFGKLFGIRRYDDVFDAEQLRDLSPIFAAKLDGKDDVQVEKEVSKAVLANNAEAADNFLKQPPVEESHLASRRNASPSMGGPEPSGAGAATVTPHSKCTFTTVVLGSGSDVTVFPSPAHAFVPTLPFAKKNLKLPPVVTDDPAEKASTGSALPAVVVEADDARSSGSTPIPHAP